MHRDSAVWYLNRTERANSGLLVTVQNTAFLAGGALAILGLTAQIPQIGMEWLHLPVSAGIAGVACAIGLGLSMGSSSRGARTVVRLLAVATSLPALATIAALPKGSHGAIGALNEGKSPSVAFAFLFLALLLLFLRSRKGAASVIADVSVFGLGWAILTPAIDLLYSATHVFGLPLPAKDSPQMVLLLALLSVAAMVRRTEYGVFSYLRGGGISGRLIRILFWIVVLLPIVREAVRARLIASGVVPERSAAASLAASAVVFGMGFLLVIGYYFRRLENEIRELSLRDELTGLYNLRGFRLLADQAFRLAKRSHQPFSVMFVDVDELKLINDELGHAVGSSLLSETAELLRSSFRETDVVGRIGGDEFAIAGQFDSEAIACAAERVAAMASHGNQRSNHPSLSIGHVTAQPDRKESLEDLLELADLAMYEQKRRKKQQVAF